MTSPSDSPLSAVYYAELPDAAATNAALSAAFEREKCGEAVRRTHHFHGRFENTYLPESRIPELRPTIDCALANAKRILGRDRLRYGFWFNEMQPGQCTSLHAHEELDELLSAVYYIRATADSGSLVLRDGRATIRVEPRPGLLLLFPPDIPHEVETNSSSTIRLSVAFNFGPELPAV